MIAQIENGGVNTRELKHLRNNHLLIFNRILDNIYLSENAQELHERLSKLFFKYRYFSNPFTYGFTHTGLEVRQDGYDERIIFVECDISVDYLDI